MDLSVEIDKSYFLKVDVQYTKKVHELDNDLPFLTERMKIEKVRKHVANLHDKTKYITHLKKLKTSIKSRISFEKIS